MSSASTLDKSVEVSGSPSYQTTSLAESMLLLAMLTVFQRGIGFVRGVLFCRWLPAEQLGLWDLVFGFLMLAGPLVVLGIPGSFGRYVEHFRQKGQLRTFLRRTTIATVVLSAVGCSLLWVFHEQAAVILFKDGSLAPIIPVVSLTLVSVVGFNYFVELFIAMRQMRTVSALQFVNSVLFASVGLGLLLWYESSAESVIISYGIACSVTVVLGGVVLLRDWRQLPLCDSVPMQSEFWRKLLPFAAWLWAINLLSNLFEVVDRYMIVHFSGLSPEQSITLVGDYHSSRVVPWLMVAVANLFGGILLPHLSADWERGEHKQVSDQLNLLLKTAAMVMMAGAMVIGLTAPFLFEHVFEGKYSGGLAVLPWTLTYCVWYSLSGCAMLYFCCAEKTYAGAIVFGVGLASNVALNAMLLPMWGLTGAVVATALANAIAIVLALYLAKRHGMEVQKSTILLAAAPLLLGFGWATAMAVWIVLLWQAFAANWVFNEQEKRTLLDGLSVLTKRFQS
ncbi:oligosaccharide flippase family protein [Bremerella sp. T1]|uniref:oligosaccharide flippase family protein n=1 Tax=Bremerella sp. TYQ1 TaxID=3119568 RepID=UPI001CCD0D3F|nr:lipopolysaccharide biosynthesis protein [Bremerella volcania]UBM34011.1 lipopolysaccharide biosynthesis protein [Bremerella volcania]